MEKKHEGTLEHH